MCKIWSAHLIQLSTRPFHKGWLAYKYNNSPARYLLVLLLFSIKLNTANHSQSVLWTELLIMIYYVKIKCIIYIFLNLYLIVKWLQRSWKSHDNYCVGTLSMPSSLLFPVYLFFLFFLNASNHLMIYHLMPCEKCWYLIHAAPVLSSCISPRAREREARPSHGTSPSYWGRASLNLSIVSTWARKNGSFTSKLRPGFTERFYNSAQLTLARVARPAIEKHELP